MNNKFLKFIRSEFTGWKIFEITLLIISTSIILSLGILSKDTAITIIAAITGTIGVVLGAKGKISAFIVATVNSVLYIIIALQGQLISSVILHSSFYIPMNIIGFVLWFRKRDDQGDVTPRFLSLKGIMMLYLIMIAVWIGYSFLLINIANPSNVWLDSFILMGSILAIILTIFRYVDQWFLWILTNCISLTLWIIILININNNVYFSSTAIIFIIQYFASLVNSIYGLWNWIKLNKKSEKYKFKKLNDENLKKLNSWEKIFYNFNSFFTKK